MNVRRARPATVEEIPDAPVDVEAAEDETSVEEAEEAEESAAEDQIDEQVIEAQKPPKHAPVWQDMLRVSLIFIGCWLLVELILAPIVLGLLTLNDTEVQNYVLDLYRSGGSLSTATNDPVSQRFVAYEMWATVICILAGLALFLIIRRKKLYTTDLTTTKPVDNRWFELGAALVFILGIQMVLSLINALISLSGYDPSSVQSNLLGGGLNTVSGVLVAVIVEPFLEEWIFRGAILRQLAPYGVNFAIVTQAVLFALWHGNLYQGIFAFFVGLILGYVAYNFSLKWSYALHAISNGLAGLFGASWMPGWLPWVILGLGLAASVAIIVYLRKVVPLLVEEGAPTIEHPFKQGWKNPAFITVAAFLFLFSCLAMVVLGG